MKIEIFFLFFYHAFKVYVRTYKKTMTTCVEVKSRSVSFTCKISPVSQIWWLYFFPLTLSRMLSIQYLILLTTLEKITAFFMFNVTHKIYSSKIDTFSWFPWEEYIEIYFDAVGIFKRFLHTHKFSNFMLEFIFEALLLVEWIQHVDYVLPRITLSVLK